MHNDRCMPLMLGVRSTEFDIVDLQIFELICKFLNNYAICRCNCQFGIGVNVHDLSLGG